MVRCLRVLARNRMQHRACEGAASTERGQAGEIEGALWENVPQRPYLPSDPLVAQTLRGTDPSLEACVPSPLSPKRDPTLIVYDEVTWLGLG